MKINRKKISTVIVAVIVILFVVGIIKDQVIKAVVTVAASSVAGVPVKIGGLSLGIMTQSVRIKNFQIYNPQGFPRGAFLDIPEVSVRCDLAALLKKKLHLPKVIFNLKEVVIEKNAEGTLNVDSLKFAQPGAKSAPSKKGEKIPPEAMAMQIDKFYLNLGRVIVKDSTKPENPSVLVYEINVKDKIFENLTSAQELATVVTLQALGPTAFKSAGIYAAAAIVGVGFLPAGVAGILIGKDEVLAEYGIRYDKAFEVVRNLMEKIGQIKKEDKSGHLIEAKAEGCDLKIRFEETAAGKTKIAVSARQVVLPKAEVAAGIIYRISERLR